jgi:large subunit ribosomal protein L24e
MGGVYYSSISSQFTNRIEFALNFVLFQLVAFIDQKSRSLYMQKIKAQRLTWTQAWRRRNKKGKVETLSKKKGKRTARIFKSIQGITIEDIKKRRDAKPDFKKAQREQALREVKEKVKKAATADKKKTDKKAKKATAAAEFQKVPKQRRLQSGKQAVKSTQR